MDDTTSKNMVMHRSHFRKLALGVKTKTLHDIEELVEMIVVELNKKQKEYSFNKITKGLHCL